jgi:glycerol transport system ATP-binding protein
MAKIELIDITHIYEQGKKQTCALQGLNLTFENGVAGALLGPSGCGKTTLLNILSGLIRPTSGRVLFDGRDVTDLSTESRNIAQLFQFPVVYDSMNVYGNLAFPLRNRKVARAEVDARVRDVAELLGLGEVLSKKPRELGPGDRQLVALGRGIVREDTAVILLDEPMTQIDLHQRWVLRRELSKVQSKLGVTMIYVTHDQYEALTFAEQVVVMRDGRVIQAGGPEELYDNPQSPFIGYFVGTPGMNLFDCTIRGGKLIFKDFSLELSGTGIALPAEEGVKLQFGIRPEFVPCSPAARSGWIPAKVILVENMGEFRILTLRAGGTAIKCRAPADNPFAEDQDAWAGLLAEAGKVRIYRDNKLVS